MTTRSEALRNCDLIAGIGATEAEPPQQPPASVAPPTPSGYYEAAERASGYVVISPDGSWQEGFASLEHAQSHAYDLNLWLAEPREWMDEWKHRRPDPATVKPFFSPAADRDVSEERLMRILTATWRFEQTP
jgi:hypothetical protein